MKPKSINSLMADLRAEKGLNIKGSAQKRKLRYMGYFHGYKGYRFFSAPANLLPFTEFNDLQAVYDFDANMKSLFYGKLMFIETAIKNFSLEYILTLCNDPSFNTVYKTLCTDYKSHAVGTGKYKTAMEHRLNMRNHVYELTSKNYKKSIVSHFYDKDKPVPIWAIFELMTLGEFAEFVSCLDVTTRKNIEKSIGLRSGIDTEGKLLETILYTIKDLRNAVAHNGTIFDTRFKTSNINNRLTRYITQETKVADVTFDTIVDYLILISMLMKQIQCGKTEMLSFVRQFEELCDVFRRGVPFSIFSTVIHTDSKSKIAALKVFIKTD